MKKGETRHFLTLVSEPYLKLGKDGKNQSYGIFRCDFQGCGKEKEIRINQTKTTKSCGCYNQFLRKSRTGDKNGRFSHGKMDHPLYQCWKSMKTRCDNPKIDCYIGDKVKYCLEWDTFKPFYDWAICLWKDDLVLGRKDIYKDFCPENCLFIKRGESEKYLSKEEIRKKIDKTNLDRYGFKHALHNPEIRKKQEQTCLERYGGKTPLDSPEIQDKIKQICLEKYGVENPFKLEIFRKKASETCLKNFGSNTPFESQEIRNKGLQTCLDTFGTEYVNQFGPCIKYDNKSIRQWAEELDRCYSSLIKDIRRYGFEEAIQIKKRESRLELNVKKWLENEKIFFTQQKNVDGKRADFLLENKIILECDGIFWHSDAIREDKYYHKNKRLLYLSHNYIPLFFREDEINNKFEIVQSIIKNKVNKSNKIYARKCKIKILSNKECSEFIKNNHLMGQGSGRGIGLLLNNEILACIQIKKNLEGFEISRFCTKLNTSVIGGFSKLLSFIIKIFKPKFISTFIDLRYGSGDYLLNLGFKKINEDLSFRWIKDDKTFHRMKYPGNTGYENRCFKLWDCGQANYKLEIL